jgi:hypothetical protein
MKKVKLDWENNDKGSFPGIDGGYSGRPRGNDDDDGDWGGDED